MNQTIELLTEVYKNAELTKELLGKLVKCNHDSEFKRIMADQSAEYHDIMLEAQRQFASCGQAQAPKGYSAAERAGAHWPIILHGYVANNVSHLAEALIHETTIRLIDICRAVRSCPEANEYATELAHRLRITEENNLRQTLRHV